MTTPKFQVGQKVIVTHRERSAFEAEVMKVGRTLVYVSDLVFYAEDGRQKRHPNAGGYAHQILTPEQYAEQQERVRLRLALREAGIQFLDFDGRSFTTSQLQRLLEVALDKPKEQS
jgi:hypothetical protein